MKFPAFHEISEMFNRQINSQEFSIKGVTSCFGRLEWSSLLFSLGLVGSRGQLLLLQPVVWLVVLTCWLVSSHLAMQLHDIRSCPSADRPLLCYGYSPLSPVAPVHSPTLLRSMGFCYCLVPQAGSVLGCAMLSVGVTHCLKVCCSHPVMSLLQAHPQPTYHWIVLVWHVVVHARLVVVVAQYPVEPALSVTIRFKRPQACLLWLSVPPCIPQQPCGRGLPLLLLLRELLLLAVGSKTSLRFLWCSEVRNAVRTLVSIPGKCSHWRGYPRDFPAFLHRLAASLVYNSNLLRMLHALWPHLS